MAKIDSYRLKSKAGRKPATTTVLPDGFLHCVQCDWIWRQQGELLPERCPQCRSYHWLRKPDELPSAEQEIYDFLKTILERERDDALRELIAEDFRRFDAWWTRDA